MVATWTAGSQSMSGGDFYYSTQSIISASWYKLCLRGEKIFTIMQISETNILFFVNTVILQQTEEILSEPNVGIKYIVIYKACQPKIKYTIYIFKEIEKIL